MSLSDSRLAKLSYKVTGRQAILAKVKDDWQLVAPMPDDFDGIPIANAQNSWAFAHLGKRTPNDIPTLWRAAREGVEKDWRTFDRDLFDEALSIRTMGLAKLTASLFWLNPTGFSRAINTQPLISNGAALSGKARRRRVTFRGSKRRSPALGRVSHKYLWMLITQKRLRAMPVWHRSSQRLTSGPGQPVLTTGG